jgi:hypothetical protein
MSLACAAWLNRWAEVSRVMLGRAWLRMRLTWAMSSLSSMMRWLTKVLSEVVDA